MKTKLLILLTMLFACVLQVKAAVEILGSTSEVIVGTGSNSTNQDGLASWYKNSSSQTLYLSNELGHSGTIKEIAYYVNSITAKAFTGRIKIYMAETDQKTLTSETRITSRANMTLVYDSGEGKYTGPTGTGWETFTLDNPYIYYGRNLIVVTEVSKTDFNASLYYAYTSGSNLSIVKHSDNNATNYGNAFNTTSYNAANRLNTRFKIAEYKSVTANVTGTEGVNRAIGFGTYYEANASQTLYKALEIGQSGMISQMALEFSTCAGTTSGTVKVYMAETESETLTTSNMFTSASQMTCVFDGEVVLGKNTNGWEVLNFTAPFFYSGKKNLVVAISTTRETQKGNYCKTYEVGKGRLIRSNTSSDVFGATLEAYEYVPKIRFTFTNETATVGTGDNQNLAMGYTSRNNQCAFQSLYLNTEVGRGGLINNLAFQVYSSTDSKVQHPVKIWMAEVPQTTLTKDNKLSTSNMTLVFDGNVELGGKANGDWIGVDFNKTSFLYTGTGSLVVAVGQNQETTSGNTFKAATQSSRSVYNMSNFDPNAVDQNSTNLPNARFSFAIHDCGTSYTTNGFGICKNCQKELLYEFKKPTVITGTYYRISDVGELMWFSRAVNKGQAGTSYWGYLSNDIDLTGYNWIPIGNDTNPMKCRLYGYDRNTTVGHTISGIPSTSSLIGTFSGGLYSLRLENGALVNKSNSGTLYYCLTLGSALVKSGTATINYSYYLSTGSTISNTDAAKGARTTAQMSSGQVTYELSKGSTKWYQTIGTDPYPMVSNTSKVVYQYTQCPSTTMYTNNSELSGTVQGHNWLNTVCSNCKEEPTAISQDMTLDDYTPYLRKKSATISSGHKVTYSRNFNSMSNWYPLYLPFAVQYNSTLAQNVEIAELSAYGVKDDTNNDGNINSQDQRKLTMSLLKVGDMTEPNKPYLVRAKKTGTISFPSYGATLAKNDENSLALSTMKETFVATGYYSSKTVTPAKTNGNMLNSNGTRFYSVSPSASSFPFRWVGEISNNNGTAWNQSLLPIFFTDCAYPEFAIVDNENCSYKRATEVTVKNFSYSRIFADRQIGNWQSLYLPFDLTVTSDMLEDVEIARLDDVTTKAGVDYFVVTKLESGQTLEANTLAVIRIKDSALDEDHYWNLSFDQVTLKPAANTKKVFETEQAKYTFTGVYEPYSNATSTWYAIAKSDGLLHEAGAGAKLPAYRFYLTIDGGKTSAAEIRIGFMENDPFATGICEVEEDDNQTGVYSLDGRRVQSESIQSGIYVKNGKKIWVK